MGNIKEGPWIPVGSWFLPCPKCGAHHSYFTYDSPYGPQGEGPKDYCTKCGSKNLIRVQNTELYHKLYNTWTPIRSGISFLDFVVKSGLYDDVFKKS